VAANTAHEEPNLVPLLDLVLQLVMFFMICTSFVMEQVDETVRLPIAQSAKPMVDAKGRDVVFLNINRDGQLLVVGRPKPLTTEAEIIVYLQDVYNESKRRNADELRQSKMDENMADAQSLVIIRADRDCDYASIYRVMRKCQDVGLRRIQLRAGILLKG
jgi:biopolymer transport protein ExbD